MLEVKDLFRPSLIGVFIGLQYIDGEAEHDLIVTQLPPLKVLEIDDSTYYFEEHYSRDRYGPLYIFCHGPIIQSRVLSPSVLLLPSGLRD